MTLIDSHVTQNIFWTCIFSAVFLILLAGSIIKRSQLKGWSIAAVSLLMLSDLCAMSRKLLLVIMYKRLEAVPEAGFETMARTQLPQQLLLLCSTVFLLGAFVVIFFGTQQKKNPKEKMCD